jgi:glyceraldehyde-3-phosphate dehydrogenase/erythrose-4-phosphate dehydrogenase
VCYDYLKLANQSGVTNMAKRTYEVDIRVSTSNEDAEKWNTVESSLVIDAKGYSHFSNEARHCHSMGGFSRKVYISAQNMAEAQAAVKKALGHEYRQGYHVVRPYITRFRGRRVD